MLPWKLLLLSYLVLRGYRSSRSANKFCSHWQWLQDLLFLSRIYRFQHREERNQNMKRGSGQLPEKWRDLGFFFGRKVDSMFSWQIDEVHGNLAVSEMPMCAQNGAVPGWSVLLVFPRPVQLCPDGQQEFLKNVICIFSSLTLFVRNAGVILWDWSDIKGG